jgi:hypothetical protein
MCSKTLERPPDRIGSMILMTLSQIIVVVVVVGLPQAGRAIYARPRA